MYIMFEPFYYLGTVPILTYLEDKVKKNTNRNTVSAVLTDAGLVSDALE